MSDSPDVLLVDDEVDLLEALAGHLRDRGHPVVAVDGPQAALEILSRCEPGLAILDVRMPGGSGIELFRRIRESWPDLPVVILTGHSRIEDAVQAVRLGALDYLTKPIGLAALDRVVDQALEIRALQRRALSSREDLEHREEYFEILGTSRCLHDLLGQLDRVAPTDGTVLIEGESGTGKELVARAIHRASRRRDQPFVVLGVTTLSETLVESELFGHRKGAFTGATSEKLGLVEVADRGTLFIDEIGEMSLSCQARLLRLFETGEFRPVGATESRQADLRFVAATNRCLAEEVKRGRFREDLFYRLAVFRLRTPPLRERIEDIPLLVDHFMARLGRRCTFQPEAFEALKTHSWPGNVRELVHVVERAVICHGEGAIGIEHIVFAGLSGATISPDGKVHATLATIEAEHISRVLASFEGNKRQAARALGISLRNLYRKIERYSLGPGDVSVGEPPHA
ncbi:MAG: sigma-54-dependent Fis family transcriptional regulator [Planctomycetes bacterium]|nr:sigma-54-dependent Fis family transcriptional regulator [Planctomycetota bacterium]